MLKGKSLWTNNISRVQEYELFSKADDNNWVTSNGPTADYWGILDKGDTELGTEGEWLCKFERPINGPDPWHGYPVGENTKGITPGKYLVEFWFQSGVIDKSIRNRILKLLPIKAYL